MFKLEVELDAVREDMGMIFTLLLNLLHEETFPQRFRRHMTLRQTRTIQPLVCVNDHRVATLIKFYYKLVYFLFKMSVDYLQESFFLFFFLTIIAML